MSLFLCPCITVLYQEVKGKNKGIIRMIPTQLLNYPEQLAKRLTDLENKVRELERKVKKLETEG